MNGRRAPECEGGATSSKLSALNVVAAARERTKAHRSRIYATYEEDAWLQRDKAEHLLACGALTLAVYALAVLIDRPRVRRAKPIRVLIAASASLGAGVGKEVGDHLGWWYGSLSLRDFTADLLGIAAAVAVLMVCAPRCTRRYKGVPRAPAEPAAAELAGATEHAV